MISLQLCNEIRKNEAPLRPRETEIAHAVRKILISNLQARHRTASLAKAAGTNEFYLKRIFRAAFGTSIYQMQLHYRIEYAKKALAVDGQTIRSIARECGYENAENFANAFKKIVGMAPSVFRMKYADRPPHLTKFSATII